MLAFEDRLGQFAQQAAPPLDELMAMAGSVAEAGSVAATLSMLNGYARAMHQITGLAANAGLSGLHSLCALIETNLLLLQDDARSLTPEETAALADWPMLLLGYVASHANRDSCQALLQGVSANWPLSLPLDATADELQLLMGAGEAATPADAAALTQDVAEHTSLEQSALQDVPLEEAAPEEVSPEEVSPEEVSPEEVSPEEVSPVEVSPVEVSPVEVAPVEVAPVEVAPVEVSPVEVSPVEVSPVEVAPVEVSAEPTAFEFIAPQPFPPGQFEPEAAMPEQEAFTTGNTDTTADASAAEDAPMDEDAPADEDASTVTALLPPGDIGLQHIERPMLDILLDELRPLEEAFESVITAATEGSDDDRLAALGDLLDFLERLKVTVETIGLSALAALLSRLTTELISLPGGFGEQHRDLLQRLPRAMMAYLNAPDAPAASAGLVVLLADERWPTPIAGEALAAWRTALSSIVFSAGQSQIAGVANETVEDSSPYFAMESNSRPAAPDVIEPPVQNEAEAQTEPGAQAEPDVQTEPEEWAAPAATYPDAQVPEREPEQMLAVDAVREPESAADTTLPQIELEQAPPLGAALPETEAPETGSQESYTPQAENRAAEPDIAAHEEKAPDVLFEAAPPERPVFLETSAAEPAQAETPAGEFQSAATPAEVIEHDEGGAAQPAPLPPPETGTQHVEQPMLDILLEELKPLQDEFATAVAVATRGSEDERLAALGELLDFLERVRVTVEAIGLTALAALLTQVSWELISLPEGLSERHGDLLNRLPPAMTAYLQAPHDESACADLAAVLGDTRWPAQVPDEALVSWQAALADIELAEASAEMTPARPTHATHEDISLSFPEDVNSELLEGLLHELPLQVSAFTRAITSITGTAGTPADSEQAMRAAHTLKGAANTVGIPGIANLTHHVEDILVALIEAESLPHGRLADMLINASDCLEAMSEFLLGLGPAPDNAQSVLQEVLDCANRMDHEGLAAVVSEAAPASAVPEEAPAPAQVPMPSVPVPAAEPEPEQTPPASAEPADAAQASAPEQSLRVPAPLVDELLSLAGESLISNSQLQDHLKATLIQNQALHQQHLLIQRLLAELETQVDIRGITSQQTGRQGDDFDALEFEHYSELQTISRQLMEATIDAREMSGLASEQLTALEEVLDDQLRLQMSNQRALLRTRMMPVSNIVPRLQRSVRQTGRLLDKPVLFTVAGETTSMDTNVLNDLMDPLMHMLRNAVDHGIETREARLAAGKPEEGHIQLSFAREGDTIVVRCRDDGAGLNYDAIRRIAESKGMIMPGHVHSQEELARLILSPGFSTRSEASQVSGRGVGMDVVYSRIQQMKGMLALHSQTGHGLTVELRLPASLLSMHALIIRQREKRLAISTRGIEDIRFIMREDLLEIGARHFVRDGDKLYALLRLEQVLSMPHDRRAQDRHGHPVLLLRMEDGTERAVLVQEIMESREVVMKKFSRFVPQANGVIGAAILGNGEVAPVIDLFDLLHVPLKKLAGGHATPIPGEAHPEQHARRALVVDDSLSARRAVVQLLKDEGYEIRTANDGLDAVNILEKWVPDIVISDMEMPRMNGLELTANIRHTESTKHVPVIMITSRSTAKHRQMSAAAGVDLHMIKPFSDDDLVRQVSRLMGEQT